MENSIINSFKVEDLNKFFEEHKTAKTITLIGLIFLFLSYFLENWFQQIYSCYFNLDYKCAIFLSGLFIFSSGLITILIETVWNPIKIIYYRHKFPIETFDRKYHLVLFSGIGFLFDNCDKTSHWIASWQTATDLRFHNLWTPTDKKYVKGESIELKSGIKINFDDYIQKGWIYTGGLPGK